MTSVVATWTRLALACCVLVLGAIGGRAMAQVPDIAKLKAAYARPNSIPYPADNPYSSGKIELGHRLFFDPRLSQHGTMSCASCHNPALAWGDGLALGRGVASNLLGRRSPTILNLAWAEALMWDGRADTLEQQALGPIQADVEMNLPLPDLIARLDRIPGYRTAFRASFAEEAKSGAAISGATIGKALGAFQRTVVSNKAAFDRWIDGDETAVDDAAKRGFVAFNTTAHCSACHSGWRFTDDSFHDIGLASADRGRGKIIEGVELLERAFKTPGLRNITQRGPYMHDGSVRSLSDVIRHYDGGFAQRPSLSPEIFRLNLPERTVSDLVAFLHTLTSSDDPITIPVLPAEEIN